MVSRELAAKHCDAEALDERLRRCEAKHAAAMKRLEEDHANASRDLGTKCSNAEASHAEQLERLDEQEAALSQELEGERRAARAVQQTLQEQLREHEDRHVEHRANHVRALEDQHAAHEKAQRSLQESTALDSVGSTLGRV